MPTPIKPLFDFSPFLEERDVTLPLIRSFAEHETFRSASVEELELDNDFYRRPLRPEDLDFLQFKKAIKPESVSRLPSLASNRILLCVNEIAFARFPNSIDAAERKRFEDFYSDRHQILAARIRPFLENYAFDYLSKDGSGATSVSAHLAGLQNLKTQEEQFWSGVFAHLTRHNYLQQGLRFILIQKWCLLAGMRAAVARASACGYFDFLPPAERPAYAKATQHDALLAALAEMCGVTRRPHSYWQFYLPTSIAKCNLVYALASRPDRAMALYGAVMAMETEWLSFVEAVQRACPHIALDGRFSGRHEFTADHLFTRFERALQTSKASFGSDGLERVGQGIDAAQILSGRARWDLGEQLKWLSSIEDYCRFAREVDVRIQNECPDIDRETFVEPREMCSTTHVHNDHRLVVIESGDMLFWGNLGMQLQMKAGDMVLIPDGRLHGSTVVSADCTYHQPIIPDAWFASLSREITAPIA